MPMRDRLARLVQRNPERPTLRQRAAALKASAAKVLRKPAPADATPTVAEPVSPQLPDTLSNPDAALLRLGHALEAAIAAEREACARADAAIRTSGASEREDPGAEAEAEAAGTTAANLARQVAEMPAYTADGLRLKIRALIYYDPHFFKAPPGDPDPHQILAHSLSLDAGRAGAPVAADPIFPALEEARRLGAARERLLAVCGALPDAAPEWEPEREAYTAWFDHIDNVLMQTVPTTAAGCVALARFVTDFCAEQGIPITQGTDAASVDNIGPLRLIAQSPAADEARASSLPFASSLAQSASTSADPIFAVIEESRRLFDAWTEADKLPLDGLNPGPEARAASRAFHAHCDAVLLRTVPQTPAGCAALARYAHDFNQREGWTLDQSDEGATDHLRILDLIGRSPLSTAAAPDEDPALAIASDIEKLWPEWAALAERDWNDNTPEAERRGDAMFQRRMALIEAAAALPASSSRAVRYAKALAHAWYEHVGLWSYGKPLSGYGTDGRLVLDIEASLTGAPAWTGTGTSATPAERQRPAHANASPAAEQALDLSGLSIENLDRAIRDADTLCRLISSVATAHTPGPVAEYLEKLSGSAGDLVWKGWGEMQKRAPSTAAEWEMRAKTIALPVIENGAVGEMEAFALDMLREAARLKEHASEVVARG